MHVRGQIREVFRTELSTLASLGNRIFLDSDEVPQDEELPCAVVEVGDESITHETLGASSGATLQRDTTVTVDIFYQARTEGLIAAEEILATLETRMALSVALLAIVRSSFPQQLAIVRDKDGAQATVRLRMQWLVTYSTNERDPTVAIP